MKKLQNPPCGRKLPWRHHPFPEVFFSADLHPSAAKDYEEGKS